MKINFWCEIPDDHGSSGYGGVSSGYGGGDGEHEAGSGYGGGDHSGSGGSGDGGYGEHYREDDVKLREHPYKTSAELSEFFTPSLFVSTFLFFWPLWTSHAPWAKR